MHGPHMLDLPLKDTAASSAVAVRFRWASRDSGGGHVWISTEADVGWAQLFVAAPGGLGSRAAEETRAAAPMLL